MAFSRVDTNLFVQAASQGFADGAKYGTPFSAFTNSFIDARDKQQDYETQALQNREREIAIEQAPIRTRILENQADEGEAKLALYRDNPEAYIEQLRKERELQAQQNEEKARLLQKQTQFMDILQNGTSADKAEAVLGGGYTDLFAANPKLFEFGEKTVPTWDPADRERYKGFQTSKRLQEWNAEIEETNYKKYESAKAGFLEDTEIGRIASANGVDRSVLLSRGEIRERLLPPLRPIMDTVPQEGKDIDGKPLPPKLQPRIVNGEPVVELDYNAPQEQWKMKKVFLFDGNIVKHDVDSELEKTFSGFQESWRYRNRLIPGQGGETDLIKQGQEVDKQKEAAMAAERAAATANAEQQQKYAEEFYGRANIRPQYQEAAEKVKSYAQEERLPRGTATPQPSATPVQRQEERAATPAGVSTPAPVTWPARPGRVRATPTPTFEPTRVPEGMGPQQAAQPSPTQTPGVPTPMVTPLPESIQAMNAQQQAQKDRSKSLVEEMIAKKQAGKPGATPSPAAMQTGAATPEQSGGLGLVANAQAEELPAKPDTVSYVPEMRTRRTPNVAAIERVASLPEAGNLNALAKAVMVQESAGRAGAVSPTGVAGLMQVTQGTANEIAGNADRANALDSSMLGAIYLQRLLDSKQFADNPMLALTSYNAGPLVTQIAVAMAGTTDWDTVKQFIPAAVGSKRAVAEWRRKGFTDAQIEGKKKEAQEYAENVVANFPAFVQTRSDMEIARKLKAQKVLEF
jgi:soluble lytic murein transglycosylase-like protein